MTIPKIILLTIIVSFSGPGSANGDIAVPDWNITRETGRTKQAPNVSTVTALHKEDRQKEQGKRHTLYLFWLRPDCDGKGAHGEEIGESGLESSLEEDVRESLIGIAREISGDGPLERISAAEGKDPFLLLGYKTSTSDKEFDEFHRCRPCNCRLGNCELRRLLKVNGHTSPDVLIFGPFNGREHCLVVGEPNQLVDIVGFLRESKQKGERPTCLSVLVYSGRSRMRLSK